MNRDVTPVDQFMTSVHDRAAMRKSRERRTFVGGAVAIIAAGGLAVLASFYAGRATETPEPTPQHMEAVVACAVEDATVDTFGDPVQLSQEDHMYAVAVINGAIDDCQETLGSLGDYEVDAFRAVASRTGVSTNS